MRTSASHERDFRLLWAGQGLNRLGTESTTAALPLAAVFLLAAGPLQVGALEGLPVLPVLVISLPAGAWLDRRQRRPAMVVCSLLGACVTLTVALLQWMEWLDPVVLSAAALCLGATGAVFDLGWSTHLPSLVPPQTLAAANGRLTATWALARTIGRTLGGALVAALSAAPVLLMDSFTYLISAASLKTISSPEPDPTPRAARPAALIEVLEAGRLVRRDRLLRPLLALYSLENLAEGGIVALLPLFCLHDLHLGAAAVVGAGTARAAGGVIGARVAPRLAHNLGIGRTATILSVISAARPLLLPFLAAGIPVFGLLLVISLLSGLNVGGGSVLVITAGQTRSEQATRGRVSAIARMGLLGTYAVGAICAGAVATLVGVREALVGCGGVYVISVLTYIVGGYKERGEAKVASAAT